ncbi:Hpt domain-containing protein [Pseudobacteriovorax antillogorgiicola]|uniref:HPt (Histidine-containing phosphotransfer) domain-containing protein n=1 Tax=Pseudobacteriovorax antillogorgiicola TaxID=1513793 RepID=A0A1Y6C7M4_9BACT|nr:Hpt domain-containing protein [Pseudobacteriovorax antillogorgiicola]TCS50694.1 HPt (histidine-containing phosphotransfer) domain-containing protein [Pseudobacteriovorax antillogorgiicola]SMF40420.1 HPt (histidine-containing phosphotransfer) domain-containing protein [Pseudobacteriovorax antillogorgiicola]
MGPEIVNQPSEYFLDESVLLRVWNLRKNTSLILDICKLFRRSSEEGLASIKSIQVDDDGANISYWLHRMKGSALNVGATRFAELVESQEQQVLHDSQLYMARRQWNLQRLNESYQRTLQSLDRFLEGLSAQA